MKFIDNLGRLYNVDVLQFYDKWFYEGGDDNTNIDYTKCVNMNLYKQRQGQLSTNSIRTFDQNKRRSNLAKSISDRNWDVDGMAQSTHCKDDETDDMNIIEQDNQVKDCHLLEIFKQLGLDYYNDIHLMQVIEEFTRKQALKAIGDYKTGDGDAGKDKWEFRMKLDGDCYWINHEEKVATTVYPYLKKLQNKIKNMDRGLSTKHTQFLKETHL